MNLHGNLDSKSGKEVMQIFQDLHKDGHTIILITHDNGVAAQAKRIIKIQDGKLTEIEDIATFRRNIEPNIDD